MSENPTVSVSAFVCKDRVSFEFDVFSQVGSSHPKSE
jgi:hypothetical protein